MLSFLDLPTELRGIIYGLCLVADHIVVPNPTKWERNDLRKKLTERASQDVPQLSVALLGTCRKIHEEAAVVLYGRNRFRLPTTRQRCRGTIFQRYASLFRHISVCFDFRDLSTKFVTRLVARWVKKNAERYWNDELRHWLRDHQRTKIINIWA